VRRSDNSISAGSKINCSAQPNGAGPNYSNPRHVIAFSQFEAEAIAREFHVPRERLSVVPHGVPVIDTHKTRAPGAAPRLLYAGHLLKRKNVQAIVESLDVLVHREKVLGASLTIVGAGPERARISRLIRDRGLEAHVTLKPFLAPADLVREMKRADLLMLLSNSEAYGIVVAEALSASAPCMRYQDSTQ
jgi:glycosyltransferase involved in cell wall biosynthesis